MRSRLPLLLCAGAAAALAAPSAAQAIDYCVPTTSACPGGVGTAQATFEGALDLADNTNALDRVYLAPGTYTAPTTTGFSYNLNTGPLQIIGAAAPAPQDRHHHAGRRDDAAAGCMAVRVRSCRPVELAVADNAANSSQSGAPGSTSPRPM